MNIDYLNLICTQLKVSNLKLYESVAHKEEIFPRNNFADSALIELYSFPMIQHD